MKNYSAVKNKSCDLKVVSGDRKNKIILSEVARTKTKRTNTLCIYLYMDLAVKFSISKLQSYNHRV